VAVSGAQICAGSGTGNDVEQASGAAGFESCVMKKHAGVRAQVLCKGRSGGNCIL
jgi:hypothetical protein